MDYSALLTPLPWITFLVGILTGAGGTYLADKYTDQRRKKEATDQAGARFRGLEARMPQLIAEMRDDFSKPGFESVREFVALPSAGAVFWSDRARFTYFESEHPQLLNQVVLLIEAGYARDVSTGNHPIYRISEEFVDLVLKQR